MTLVIGARCKDGVVFVADKKVVEDTIAISEKKITILPFGIVVSGAGETDFFDKFNIKLQHVISDRQVQIDTMIAEEKLPEGYPLYAKIDDFITDCETLMVKIREEYKDVSPNLHLLIGLRNDGSAELNFIPMDRGVNSVRKTFIALGTGSPYAHFFLKHLWHPDITMKEMNLLGAFIIEYVMKKELDEFVGKGYQIVMIPDMLKEPFKSIKEVSLTSAEMKKMQQVIKCFEKDVDKEYGKLIS